MLIFSPHTYVTTSATMIDNLITLWVHR